MLPPLTFRPPTGARLADPSRMMTNVRIAFCLLLVGCTSWHLERPEKTLVHTQTAVPPNYAKVCVVRTSLLASAVTFPTHDNGVLVGATRGPTHFCYLAEPGRHEIAIEADETERARLNAEAGRTYYLKQNVDNVFGWVHCRAGWINEAEAREAFESSSYEVLTGVPGEERLPPDPPVAPAKRDRP